MCTIISINPSYEKLSSIKKVTEEDEIKSSYQAYLKDESNLNGGYADELYFPRTETQICSILKYLSERGFPLTVSGSRTGIVGSAIPFGGALMSLEQMDKISDLIEETDDTFSLWVEPGLRIRTLNEYLSSKSFPLPQKKLSKFKHDINNYFFPPDPTEDSASIGGMVATNASGARSYFYGSTRNYIKGLRIALTNGEILHIERGKYKLFDQKKFTIIDSKQNKIVITPPSYIMPSVKNSCGFFSKKDMDLLDLFIGSEGTLGVISAIKLHLIQKPHYILAGISFFPSLQDALHFVIHCKNLKHTHSLLSLEFFDSHCLNLINSARPHESFLQRIPLFPHISDTAVFWEFSYKKDEIELLYEDIEQLLIKNNTSMDYTWSGLDSNEKEILKYFRHSIPELVNKIISQRKKDFPDISKISTDFSVPNLQLLPLMEIYTAFLSHSGLEYVIFGHIGENNLHINVLPHNNNEINKAKEIILHLAHEVISLRGSVAAEHGIGKLKHHFLEIQYGIQGIKEMVKIKSILDPALILGRGNIFSESYFKQ
ncbi:MAG: FAD-binding oxidoreductase [bacterium]